jgi:hypothetical protein
MSEGSLTVQNSRLVLATIVALIVFAVLPHAAAAQGYGPHDSQAAIAMAAAEHGVSQPLLWCIAYYETGGTFDPYAVGDGGESWGLFQLHRRGLRSTFHNWGYQDAFDPYESADFTAAYIATYGWAGARHWSPIKRGLC